MNWFSGERPDITPAQIVAGIPLIMNALAVYGIWTPTADEKQALRDILIWALVLLGADAAVRVGRNIGEGLGKIGHEPPASGATPPTTTPHK